MPIYFLVHSLGDVIAKVEDSSFENNGNYCDISECNPLPDKVEDEDCLIAVRLLDDHVMMAESLI